MIRFIAALDSKRGLADEHGLPWQGKIPGDVANMHAKVKNGLKLLGYGHYVELSKPYADGINYVASSRDVELKPGFELVRDARAFLEEHRDQDVWNMGGAGLFEATLDLADELYITQLDRDFHCTKFFPEFEDRFELVSESQPRTENGITYTFQVWKRK